MICVLK